MSEPTTDRRAPRPRPLSNCDYEPFYAAIQERRLTVQQCRQCNRIQHPPGPMCPACHSFSFRSMDCTGRGILHSYVIHHHPPLAGFKTPIAIGLADMEEGFRLVAGILDGLDFEPEIGTPLQIEFEEVEPGFIIYGFRKARV